MSLEKTTTMRVTPVPLLRLAKASSTPSIQRLLDETELLLTAHFKHLVTEGGHAVITGESATLDNVAKTSPLMISSDATPGPPEDNLQSRPTEAEFLESTQNTSRPLRAFRSARKRREEAAVMKVLNVMFQVQEQLAAADTLAQLLKTPVGVVKELTWWSRWKRGRQVMDLQASQQSSFIKPNRLDVNQLFVDRFYMRLV
jgi:hypothetical protein